MSNKALTFINIFLLFAVLALYILFIKSHKNCKDEQQYSSKNITLKTDGDADIENRELVLPVAYIDIDSVLLKYDFAKEKNEVLLKKQETSRLHLQQKLKEFEEDYIDFQKKLENNVYATRERAEQENNRLAKKQLELQNLEVKLSEDLYKEQEIINRQLKDSLDIAIATFNQGKQFHIIFSNTMGDNILYSQPEYNITKDILKILNKRYQEKKKGKK